MVSTISRNADWWRPASTNSLCTWLRSSEKSHHWPMEFFNVLWFGHPIENAHQPYSFICPVNAIKNGVLYGIARSRTIDIIARQLSFNFEKILTKGAVTRECIYEMKRYRHLINLLASSCNFWYEPPSLYSFCSMYPTSLPLLQDKLFLLSVL